MGELFNKDAVAFDSDDKTVKGGFADYAKPVFDDLKPYFFAVMLHGDYGAVYVEKDKLNDPFEFAPILKDWYKKFGRNRVILLVSCWAGWGFARPLARTVQLPIVAGLSQVEFGWPDYSMKGPGKQNLCVSKTITGHDTPMKFKPEWMFCHPNGHFETIPGGYALNHNEAIKMAKKYVRV